jgi:hypothetical protein
MKYLIAISAAFFSVGQAIAGETIRNEAFGFEVTLPDGWVQSTAAQYYENISRIQADDPEFQDALMKHANTPLVMAMKYPEPFEDVNPSFKINARPYGPLSDKDGVAIIEVILPTLQSAFTDMAITSPPTKVTVGGRAAGHVAIKYSMKTPVGELPTASELWIIPDVHYFYIIGIGFRQDESTGARAEAAQPVETLTFDTLGEKP